MQGEARQQREEASRLLVGKNRSRFIENEDLRSGEQDFDNFDPLALGNGQFVDAAAGIDLKAKFGGLFSDLSFDRRERRERNGRANSRAGRFQ